MYVHDHTVQFIEYGLILLFLIPCLSPSSLPRTTPTATKVESEEPASSPKATKVNLHLRSAKILLEIFRLLFPLTSRELAAHIEVICFPALFNGISSL